MLGFELQQRFGDDAAFVSAGGYHHHIGLNTWQSKGGSPPPPGTHRPLPHRDPLPDPARPRRRAAPPERGRRRRSSGASDHGVSEALYLDDPDGNGIELYWDRPREEWPTPQTGEKVEMFTAPARPPRPDLGARLAAAGYGPLNPIAKQGPPPQLSLSGIAPSKKSETSCCSAGVARGAPCGSSPVRFGRFS